MSDVHDARAAAALGVALERMSEAFEAVDRAVGSLPQGAEAGAALQCRAELADVARRLSNLRVLVQAETKRTGAPAPSR